MRPTELCLGVASRLLPGLVWVFVTACALRITPAPIEPHLVAVSDHDSSQRLSLGVGLFVDQRPLEGRVEVHPPLRVHGIGFARRGEVRTGDASFVGEIVAGVRRDAVATLTRAAIFREVRPVEIGDSESRAWPGSPGVDLILTASVKDFGAFQHQDSTLSLLRPAWLRNRFDDSIGFASVHYRLYDASGLLHAYDVRADHVSGGQPITRAALDAMAVANETLARRLYADLGRAAEPEPVVVTLRVLDACGLGAEGVRTLMRDAGEIFEREAGLRFRVEHSLWREPVQRAGIEAVLAELRRNVPGGDGAVLALVSRRDSLSPSFAGEPFGLADPFGQHAVVGCVADAKPPVVTLAHELAHLFGAVHVHDRGSVMYASMEFDARFFDPLNRRILRATRARPWGAPLPKEMERRVRSMYAAAARFPGCCDAKSLEAALAALPRR